MLKRGDGSCAGIFGRRTPMLDKVYEIFPKVIPRLGELVAGHRPPIISCGEHSPLPDQEAFAAMIAKAASRRAQHAISAAASRRCTQAGGVLGRGVSAPLANHASASRFPVPIVPSSRESEAGHEFLMVAKLRLLRR